MCTSIEISKTSNSHFEKKKSLVDPHKFEEIFMEKKRNFFFSKKIAIQNFHKKKKFKRSKFFPEKNLKCF